MKLILSSLLLVCLAVPCALGETLSMQEMLGAQDAIALTQESQAVDTPSSAAREDFIDRILATAKSLYDAAGGIPAIAEVKFSLSSNRGCLGECAFCALNFHQGRIIQSRSD